MGVTADSKTCLACGKAVKGRSDKKFCDDYCRNNYNNELKADSNNYVRNINNALKKNRRILEELLPPEEEMKKTTKERLLNAGFQFKYTTHTYTNKKGNTYFFCYEYGYLPLENDWFLVVKRKEE
jgi:predicted nucleic acid-binding Zn ribbon protein